MSQILTPHGGDADAGLAELVARPAFQKLPAAAHVRGDAGTPGRHGLQDRRGLALGQACKYRKIQLFHVFNHVDAPCKNQVFEL